MHLDATPVAARVTRAARNLGLREHGWVLGFHPVARMNPFQSLLYSRAFDSGFVPVGLTSRQEFSALRLAAPMGAGAVLHLHWTSEVLGGAVDEEEALTKSDEFLSELQMLKDDRVRLVWTVHNTFPHRCKFPEIESALRAQLAQLVDVIHVMAEDTVAETSAFYELPAGKLVQVPHPSYLGAYPRHVDRFNSRFDMGYDFSDLVLGVVGSIQPYRGLRAFADATRSLSKRNPRLRAVIGGLPGRDDESKELVNELEQTGHIDLVARKLTDLELASMTIALDASVLPYRASLNSGAAMLALSFGIPIVAPMTGNFRQLIQAGFGIGYELDETKGLESALETVPDFVADFERDRALEYASSISGPVVSERFFAGVREVLGE